MSMDNQLYSQSLDKVWVFGYGSLLWNPDIKYRSRKIGYVRGYIRRFWQNNTTHRGTQEQPGRVATLVEDEKGTVWGVAYEVEGRDDVTKAIGNLNNRETKLGGYTTLETDFYARPEGDNGARDPIKVVLYMATSENPLYTGPCDLQEMAQQIVNAQGFKGPNTEYVTKMTDYVKSHIPEDDDEHLFELDNIVRQILKSREISSKLLPSG